MRRVVVALALAGCGDGPGDQAIRGEPTLETFTNRMCACHDRACTTQVIDDLARWSRLIKSPRSDPANAKQLMARYNACMREATR